ncbi:MAG: putative Ig domain-containing protein [Gammaproteobacteria bacterium]
MPQKKSLILILLTGSLALLMAGCPQPPGPPEIKITTSSPLPQGKVGERYKARFMATGGQAPYTWSGGPPAGLGLSLKADGKLTGTPTKAGSFKFDVKVTDYANRSVTKNFQLKVKVVDGRCAITTTSSLPNGTVGQTYGPVTLQASSGCKPPLTWSVGAGALPPGLTLNAQSGVIGGTPTQAGTFNFTIKVTDSTGQSDTNGLQITITTNGPECEIATSLLPNGTVNQSYPAVTLQTRNCTPPLTWSVSAGALPPGLRLNAQAGVIDGTPSQADTFNFAVRVSSAGQLDTQDLQITIGPPVAVCEITTTSPLPDGRVNQPYPPQTLRTTGCTAPLTWSVSAGALPPGLNLNAQTGVIGGTATGDGTFNFTVRVTDSASPAQSDTEGFRIVIEGRVCGTHTVSMNNLQFIPRTLTVRACETVNWVHNQPGVPHTVTSDTGVFENGTVANPMVFQQTFSHTFANPGTFPYHCRIHGAPGGNPALMTGSITVNPNP